MVPEGPYFLYDTEFNEAVSTPPTPGPAPAPVSTSALVAPSTTTPPATIRSAIKVHHAYSPLVDISDDTKLTQIFNTLSEIENDLKSAEAQGISAGSAIAFRTALEKFQTLFDKSKKKDAGLVTDKLIEILAEAEKSGDITYLQFFDAMTPIRLYELLFNSSATFTLSDAKDIIEQQLMSFFRTDPNLAEYLTLHENFTTNC